MNTRVAAPEAQRAEWASIPERLASVQIPVLAFLGLYFCEEFHLRAPIVAESSRVSQPEIDEAYVLPHFGDWPFVFTRIDAVYVWTHGGYQIARNPDDYPLFLAVQEEDVADWEAFFERFGIPTGFDRQPSDAISGALHVVLYPQPELDAEWVDGSVSNHEFRRTWKCAHRTPQSVGGPRPSVRARGRLRSVCVQHAILD